MRKLSWIIAGILCTMPVTVMAAELGDAKLESHLTERLKVIIPISGLHGTPLDEIKIRLAPEHYYDQAGIPLDPLVGNIVFQVKSGRKGPYLIVSSKHGITDPILSLLLEISTTNGQYIKEYDLLLNPPYRGPSSNQRPAAVNTPVQSAQNVPARRQTQVQNTASTSAPEWHAVKNVPDVKMNGNYKVKRGDTLYDIAKQASAGATVPIRPLMQAIIDANPTAFVDGNGNNMRAGAVLKVPGTTAAPAEKSPVAAAAPTKNADTQQPKAATEASQPKLQLLSADSTPATTKSADATNSNQTEGDGSNELLGQPILPAIDSPSTASTASAQLNNEAIASIDAKSQAMSQQIELLNKQLKQVQDQILVRNENIDQLQKKVHVSESQTKTIQEQLEKQKNSFWIQWGPYLAGGVGVLLIGLLLMLMTSRSRKADRMSSDAHDPIYPLDASKASEKQLDSDKEVNDSPSADSAAFALGESITTSHALQTTPPQFDGHALIEEARLLVSYNLHTQAIDMLQDAVSDHPDELPLYQELARIHAESNNEVALGEVLAEIDTRFGADQRPDFSAITHATSQTTAPISIFDTAARAAPDQAPIVSVEPAPMDLSLPTTPSTSNASVSSDSEFENRTINTPLNTPVTSSNDIEFSLEDMGSSSAVLPTADLDTVEEQGSSMDLNLDLPTPAAPASLDMPMEDLGAPVRSVQQSESNDTRLGLVEAFLGVGDKESYKMIADEIISEGDASLIEELRKIEKAHGV